MQCSNNAIVYIIKPFKLPFEEFAFTTGSCNERGEPP